MLQAACQTGVRVCMRTTRSAQAVLWPVMAITYPAGHGSPAPSPQLRSHTLKVTHTQRISDEKWFIVPSPLLRASGVVGTKVRADIEEVEQPVAGEIGLGELGVVGAEECADIEEVEYAVASQVWRAE